MKIFNSVLLLIVSINLYAEEYNFCKNTFLIKEGNTYQACGVGEAKTESKARELSADNAISEFKATCKLSMDCDESKIVLNPLKTSCEQLKNGMFKCYRGIQIENKGYKVDDFGDVKIPAAIMIGIGVGNIPIKAHQPYFKDSFDIMTGFSINYATRTVSGNAHMFSFWYGTTENDITMSDNASYTFITNSLSSFGIGYSYLWVSNNNFFVGPGVTLNKISASTDQLDSSTTSATPLEWSSLGILPNVKFGYKPSSNNSFYALATIGQNIITERKPTSSSNSDDIAGNLEAKIEIGYKKSL